MPDRNSVARNPRDVTGQLFRRNAMAREEQLRKEQEKLERAQREVAEAERQFAEQAAAIRDRLGAPGLNEPSIDFRTGELITPGVNSD